MRSWHSSPFSRSIHGFLPTSHARRHRTWYVLGSERPWLARFMVGHDEFTVFCCDLSEFGRGLALLDVQYSLYSSYIQRIFHVVSVSTLLGASIFSWQLSVIVEGYEGNLAYTSKILCWYASFPPFQHPYHYARRQKTHSTQSYIVSSLLDTYKLGCIWTWMLQCCIWWSIFPPFAGIMQHV